MARSSVERTTMRSFVERTTMRTFVERTTMRTSVERTTMRTSVERTTMRSFVERTTMRTFVERTTMRTFVALATVAIALAPGVARAADVVLDRLAPSAIKLDGKIKDWPGTTAANEVIKPGKASATFVAGYDDQGLWVGGEIAKEGPIARTSSFGANEDCVGLVVAFPKSGVSKPGDALVAHEIGIYAGVPGSSSGVVKFRAGPLAGKTIDGAKIIEANRAAGGYTFEAYVPWSAFPDGKKVRAGLRGALRMYDGDGKSIRAIKATGPGSVESPSQLGYLLIEPEQSIPQALAAKKLSFKDVTFDVSADFAGDGTHERALFVGRTVFVLGPTYKEGKQWLVADVGADVSSVEARDVTGDGKVDLLLTTRTKNAGVTREALLVWSFIGGSKGAETPSRVFAHETLVESGGNALRDNVTFEAGKKPTVKVTYQAPKGFTVDNYKEPIAADVDPILWPWGAVKERTFVWSGSSFVKDKEIAQKATAPTESKAPSVEPVKPAVTAPGDLVAAALEKYRKTKGLPDVEPPERLQAAATLVPGKKGKAVVYGTDLVLAPGDGGYAVLSMGRFASDKDVLELVAKDMTGDGRDELVVRGVARAKLTQGTQETTILRELLLVYSPKAQGAGLAVAQVFGAETGRASAKQRVEVDFRLVTSAGGKPGRIELMKGKASGWSKDNWPFTTEQPMPGIEPLLLPWGSESKIVYEWKGDRFAR